MLEPATTMYFNQKKVIERFEDDTDEEILG